MLKEKCERFMANLKSELEPVTAHTRNAATGLSASVEKIRRVLHLLRAEVEKNQFANAEEEIWFFKQEKPRFQALLICAVREFNLFQHVPAGTADQIRAYYLQELEVIRRFFLHNAFLYGYYRNGMTELDGHYFIRGKGAGSAVLPAPSDPDPSFSTAADYVFAKFIAFERLQDLILGQLRELDPVSPVTESRKVRSLRWTGESINLVELGYGLYESGQLNEGKAGIGEIFSWLEEKLKVSIGIPARRFVEISRRKRLSRTKFLDQLRDAVNRKADEGDAFVPGKGNRKPD